MRGIEVGNRAKLPGVPCVEDLPGEADSLEQINPFRVGADIHGLRVSVVKVKLQTVSHVASQAELTGVISAVADAPPCVERRKLRRVEGVRSDFSIDGGARRITASRGPAAHLSRQVDILQRTGSVASKIGEEVVHGLCSSDLARRGAGRATQGTKRATF